MLKININLFNCSRWRHCKELENSYDGRETTLVTLNYGLILMDKINLSL